MHKQETNKIVWIEVIMLYYHCSCSSITSIHFCIWYKNAFWAAEKAKEDEMQHKFESETSGFLLVPVSFLKVSNLTICNLILNIHATENSVYHQKINYVVTHNRTITNIKFCIQQIFISKLWKIFYCDRTTKKT